MPESIPGSNHNQIIYSISEVSQALKRMVEDHFGVVRLRGEISGYKLHSSGHGYFTLKDDASCIDAVCWRGSLSKMKFRPEDGLEVVATGRLTTYPGRSKYQIVVENMEPAGAGALMALLEKRRAMLEAEGVFAAARKKKLPYMPRVIGVVTSPTGAVIQDILHRITDRFPVHVIVWPVAVQGENAAAQIADAIHGFNAMPKAPDLLIVARGGGSLEDLWAFNEEIVVRAAAASAIPLISAVGHETDTTLIDYASDMRAPTPTAAAEMAVPVRTELQLAVSQLGVRLQAAPQQQLQRYADKLQGLARGLPKPDQLLQFATQKLDDWGERLRTSLPAFLQVREQRLALCAQGLKPVMLVKELEHQSRRTHELEGRLQYAASRALTQQNERLRHASLLLEHLNVQRVLERGFVLVRGDQNAIIKTADAAKKQQHLELQFADGKLKVL